MNKDFTTDAADIFVTKFAQEPQQQPQRKPQTKKPTRTASQGQQERICIMLDSATMEEVRAIAYFDRMKIVDIFRTAVEAYIKKHEKEHGKIQGR